MNRDKIVAKATEWIFRPPNEMQLSAEDYADFAIKLAAAETARADNAEAEVKKLTDELQLAKVENNHNWQCCKDAEQMRAALEIYGDEQNWHCSQHDNCPNSLANLWIHNNGFQIAREALDGGEEKT